MEAKASKTGKLRLGKSNNPRTGEKNLVQMSEDWVQKTIDRMKVDTMPLEIQATGQFLEAHFDSIRRKIGVMDKDAAVRWNNKLPGESMSAEIKHVEKIGK